MYATAARMVSAFAPGSLELFLTRTIRICAVLLAGLGFAASSRAADYGTTSSNTSSNSNRPTDQFEIGIEGYSYQYREPLFAKLEGYMFGLNGTYTYNFNPRWFLRANIIGDFGSLDYSSDGTGTETGITAEMVDMRGLFGRNIKISRSVGFTPFAGLGLRILFDEDAERLSSTGAIGYDRTSYYAYLPVGGTFNFKIGRWGLAPTAEYDYLIRGFQVSDLSQVGFDNDVVNRQKVGYGIRGDIMVSPPVDFYHFSFGPFVRYWNIHDSDSAEVDYQGQFDGYGIEPGNNTLELGLRANIHF